VRNHLSAEPDRVRGLVALAYLKTDNQQQLDNRLREISAEAVPAEIDPKDFEVIRTRKKVDACLDAVRLVIPKDWEHVLYKRKLIDTYSELFRQRSPSAPAASPGG
jgi:hypothetical protein